MEEASYRSGTEGRDVEGSVSYCVGARTALGAHLDMDAPLPPSELYGLPVPGLGSVFGGNSLETGFLQRGAAGGDWAGSVCQCPVKAA